MPYLDHGSGGLNCNRHLTGSMWGDIKWELGIAQREDEEAMGWRQPEQLGPVAHAAGFAWGAFKALGFGQVKAAFGGR